MTLGEVMYVMLMTGFIMLVPMFWVFWSTKRTKTEIRKERSAKIQLESQQKIQYMDGYKAGYIKGYDDALSEKPSDFQWRKSL